VHADGHAQQLVQNLSQIAAHCGICNITKFTGLTDEPVKWEQLITWYQQSSHMS
jgi:surfactin synthase thioesterase subunit